MQESVGMAATNWDTNKKNLRTHHRLALFQNIPSRKEATKGPPRAPNIELARVTRVPSLLAVNDRSIVKAPNTRAGNGKKTKEKILWYPDLMNGFIYFVTLQYSFIILPETTCLNTFLTMFITESNVLCVHSLTALMTTTRTGICANDVENISLTENFGNESATGITFHKLPMILLCQPLLERSVNVH